MPARARDVTRPTAKAVPRERPQPRPRKQSASDVETPERRLPFDRHAVRVSARSVAPASEGGAEGTGLGIMGLLLLAGTGGVLATAAVAALRGRTTEREFPTPIPYGAELGGSPLADGVPMVTPPPPPPPPRSAVPKPARTAGPAWESCEIDWWRGYVKSQFVARRLDGSPIAVSPFFAWRRSEPPPSTGEAERAFEVLLEELHEHGWRLDSTGAEWFDRRLRRKAAA